MSLPLFQGVRLVTMPDAANAPGVTADFDQEERKWATLIKLNLTGD